jgi:hypothetical protein
MNPAIRMCISSRACKESQTSVSKTADMRFLSHSCMYASNIAKASWIGDPDAAEVGLEEIHYPVGDHLEFLLQFAGAEQILLKQVQSFLAYQGMLTVLFGLLAFGYLQHYADNACYLANMIFKGRFGEMKISSLPVGALYLCFIHLDARL